VDKVGETPGIVWTTWGQACAIKTDFATESGSDLVLGVPHPMWEN